VREAIAPETSGKAAGQASGTVCPAVGLSATKGPCVSSAVDAVV
jgi:hypothetical protein